MRELGFPSNVSKVKLADLLEERYPDYKWEKVYLLKGRFAQQKQLERNIRTLFQVRAVLFVVLCCPNLVFIYGRVLRSL